MLHHMQVRMLLFSTRLEVKVSRAQAGMGMGRVNGGQPAPLHVPRQAEMTRQAAGAVEAAGIVLEYRCPMFRLLLLSHIPQSPLGHLLSVTHPPPRPMRHVCDGHPPAIM